MKLHGQRPWYHEGPPKGPVPWGRPRRGRGSHRSGLTRSQRLLPLGKTGGTTMDSDRTGDRLACRSAAIDAVGQPTEQFWPSPANLVAGVIIGLLLSGGGL